MDDYDPEASPADSCRRCGEPNDPEFARHSGDLCGDCLADDAILPLTEIKPPDDLELRKEAARCARMLVEASRNIPDVREMVMGICGRLGHPNIVELADNDPKSVIELWEAVELLEQDSYDAVLKRSKS